MLKVYKYQLDVLRDNFFSEKCTAKLLHHTRISKRKTIYRKHRGLREGKSWQRRQRRRNNTSRSASAAKIHENSTSAYIPLPAVCGAWRSEENRKNSSGLIHSLSVKVDPLSCKAEHLHRKKAYIYRLENPAEIACANRYLRALSRPRKESKAKKRTIKYCNWRIVSSGLCGPSQLIPVLSICRYFLFRSL